MSTTNLVEKNNIGAVAKTADSTRLNTQSQLHHQRIKSLDGLRSVAFLSVFFYHLGRIPGYTRGPAFFYSEVVNWGFLGVDLFFVISGFIITALLLDEQRRTQSISIKMFFQRRILRIWPLFYLTLLSSIVGAVLFAKPDFDFGMYAKVLQRAYLPLGCFFYILPLPVTELIAKLMDQTRFPIIQSIAPTWSVCVEEQFYLIWPWMVAFIRNKRQLIAAVLLMVGISELCRAFSYPHIPGFFYLNPISRVTPLAVGALIAIGAHNNARWYQFVARHSGAMFAIAAAAALYVVLGPAKGLATLIVLNFPCYPAIALCLGALLIAALHNATMKRILSTQWLRRLGKYTYCMYLVHFLIIYVTRPFEWTFLHDNLIRHILWGVLAFSITFAVAKLSWVCLEGPLARLRSKFTA